MAKNKIKKLEGMDLIDRLFATGVFDEKEEDKPSDVKPYLSDVVTPEYKKEKKQNKFTENSVYGETMNSKRQTNESRHKVNNKGQEVKPAEKKQAPSFFISVRNEFGSRLNMYDSVLPHYASMDNPPALAYEISDMDTFNNNFYDIMVPYCILMKHPAIILTEEEMVEYLHNMRIDRLYGLTWFLVEAPLNGDPDDRVGYYYYGYKVNRGVFESILESVDAYVKHAFSDDNIDYNENDNARILYESIVISVMDQFDNPRLAFKGNSYDYVIKQYLPYLKSQVQIKYNKDYKNYVMDIMNEYMNLHYTDTEYDGELIHEILKPYHALEVVEKEADFINGIKGFCINDDMYDDNEYDDSDEEYPDEESDYEDEDSDDTEENDDAPVEINDDLLRNVSANIMRAGLDTSEEDHDSESDVEVDHIIDPSVMDIAEPEEDDDSLDQYIDKASDVKDFATEPEVSEEKDVDYSNITIPQFRRN